MKINGKEINFKFTVRAQLAIAALCPEKKWKNFLQLFDGNMTEEERANNLYQIGRIMNNNFEQCARRDRGEPYDFTGDYSLFTFDDYLDLTAAEEAEYEAELLRAINRDSGRSVEAAPPKGSKKNKKVQESN